MTASIQRRTVLPGRLWTAARRTDLPGRSCTARSTVLRDTFLLGRSCAVGRRTVLLGRSCTAACRTVLLGRSYIEQRATRHIGLPRTRGSAGASPSRSAAHRAAFTIVELLVVTLIVTILAVSVGQMIAAALTLEQQYREESDVMESLADTMAYVERYVSLANNLTTNGNGVAVATFRMEAGGVSFETGHWTRVSQSAIMLTNNVLGCQITSGDGDPDKQPTQTRTFDADGRQIVAPAVVTVVRIDGVGQSVVQAVLEASVPVKTRTGTVTNKTVSAERPIRLWNK